MQDSIQIVGVLEALRCTANPILVLIFKSLSLLRRATWWVFPVVARCGSQCCSWNNCPWPQQQCAQCTGHKAAPLQPSMQFRSRQVKREVARNSAHSLVFTLVSPCTPAHFANARKKLATTGRLLKMECLAALAANMWERHSKAFEVNTLDTLVQRLHNKTCSKQLLLAN
jgi:hypothetical protein